MGTPPANRRQLIEREYVKELLIEGSIVARHEMLFLELSRDNNMPAAAVLLVVGRRRIVVEHAIDGGAMDTETLGSLRDTTSGGYKLS